MHSNRYVADVTEHSIGNCICPDFDEIGTLARETLIDRFTENLNERIAGNFQRMQELFKKKRRFYVQIGVNLKGIASVFLIIATAKTQGFTKIADNRQMMFQIEFVNLKNITDCFIRHRNSVDT